MSIVMTVRAEGTSGAAEELRGWLLNEPELRGRVRRESTEPPPGAMGPATDALVALLEPGGVAAVFAGAIVAWVQTRRGNHTVTVTRADGTSITISTRQARSLSPQELAELAERLARPAERAELPGEEQGGAERPREDPAP
ncbi:effector-associated constant component EACC1 [Streptomyces sp. OZ13]|uniref:effector-associated constant component EACC1 n=1 Tax=Streptomyces sp. OZ13 TaxID=3452210 RepID=UPI003F88FFE0